MTEDRISIEALRAGQFSTWMQLSGGLLEEDVTPTVLALVEVVEAAEELKLWEPGRAGYAAALKRVFEKTARFDLGQGGGGAA